MHRFFRLIFFQMSSTIFNNHKQSITYGLLISAVILLIINYTFRQSLYWLGIQMIRSMQSENSSFGRGFFQLVTMISQPLVIMVLVVIIMFGEVKKKHSFNVVMFLLFNIYLITLLKSFYSDPRPFWSTSDVKSLANYCPSQFGNPSGHSWFATVISFILVFKYFPSLNRPLSLIIIALLVILVPLSRLYLGAHSLNQVILGVCLGMIMNCLYLFCKLDDLISQFLQNFNTIPMLGWKKYMLLFNCLYAFSYFFTGDTIEDSPAEYAIYSANIMSECGKQLIAKQLNFNILIANSLIVNFSTGVCLGYDRMYLSQRGKKYLQGKWEINEQRFPQLTGKVLYYWIQSVCLFGGIICAGLTLWIIDWKNNILIFVILNIGVLLSGYIYSGKCFKLLYHYSIIIQML